TLARRSGWRLVDPGVRERADRSLLPVAVPVREHARRAAADRGRPGPEMEVARRRVDEPRTRHAHGMPAARSCVDEHVVVPPGPATRLRRELDVADDGHRAAVLADVVADDVVADDDPRARAAAAVREPDVVGEVEP